MGTKPTSDHCAELLAKLRTEEGALWNAFAAAELEAKPYLDKVNAAMDKWHEAKRRADGVELTLELL
jgi:hypothetical protein